MAYVVAFSDQLRLHSFVGPEAYQLAHGHTPAWSPDGEKIAYITGGRCGASTRMAAAR